MKNKGFTIIETMISLMIIMVGVIQIASIIGQSINLSARSRKIFYINQTLENIKNKLLSEKYNSIKLKEGTTTKTDCGYKVFFKIVDVTPSLKKINLSIIEKGISQKKYFYKSKYIN